MRIRRKKPTQVLHHLLINLNKTTIARDRLKIVLLQPLPCHIPRGPSAKPLPWCDGGDTVQSRRILNESPFQAASDVKCV